MSKYSKQNIMLSQREFQFTDAEQDFFTEVLNPIKNTHLIEEVTEEKCQRKDNFYGYEGYMLGYENAKDDYHGLTNFYHDSNQVGDDNRNHEENYSDSNVARMGNNYSIYSFAN